MKWYYNSDDDETLHECDTHDDVVTMIMFTSRYPAMVNSVPDYYIYHGKKKVETILRKDLFKWYIENGGEVLEGYMDKENEDEDGINEIDNKKTMQEQVDELSDTIHGVNNSLAQLENNIRLLTQMMFGGDDNER